MRIFIRMLLICWVVMLALVSLVTYWPSIALPLQDDRERTLPLQSLDLCAQHDIDRYRAGGTHASLQNDPHCFEGRLIPLGSNTDIAGRGLAREERQLVRRAGQGSSLSLIYLHDTTLVALPPDPGSPDKFVYLAKVPFALTQRDTVKWHVRRAGRLVFLAGVLSLLVVAYFVRPITRLSTVAEAFGDGDLKARVNPSLARRKDELGDLGRTFNEMAERIESLVSGYKSFLAHASHELGSPLTRLNLALALARWKAGNGLEQEHDRIGQEADRLNSLVQEMMLLARLESGNELNRTPVLFDVAAIVQEAYENAAFEAQQAARTVTLTQLDKVWIRGYPDLLLRALDNVLRNGLRFARQQVRIQVSSRSEQGSNIGVILIEDDGPGVPEETEEEIFQPFFTVSDVHSDEIARGSGLGLAIARQAALANGGKISAHRSQMGGLAVVIECRVDLDTGS